MKLLNLTATVNGAVREVQFNERAHLVAPVVLLVEGVHDGSGGPVFYPAAELAKFAASWNSVPVTLGHPKDTEGEPISANSPEVLSAYCVGYLFNVQFDPNGAKLRGEVWVDIEACAAKPEGPVVLATLRSGSGMEVSTGLWSEHDSVPGVWQGESYIATVFNYRPDHLALLMAEAAETGGPVESRPQPWHEARARHVDSNTVVSRSARAPG